MDTEKITSRCDHTLLAQTATWEEIKSVCDDAIKYRAASVCIPPCYVKRVKEYVGERMRVCTVVGFPNGYNTANVKAFETKTALEDGADEIDMVINIGELKAKNYKYVQDEISLLKSVCGDKILKVIVETCLLTEEEKIKMCELVTAAHADFIKTSTGFSKSGATLDDVKLFVAYVGKGVSVKAAGGISSLEDAEKFIDAGAERLGTSRVIKILKSQNK